MVSRLIPEDKVLPVRANVANRTRDEMEQYVRARNPEWWEREQQRRAQAEQRATARGDTARRPNRAVAPASPCVPSGTDESAPGIGPSRAVVKPAM